MHLDQETLNRYLDGLLHPSEQQMADRHLASCSHCAEELAGLQELFAAFDALPAEPPPTDVAALVAARLATQARPAVDRTRELTVALMATQLALGLLLAFWLASAFQQETTRAMNALGTPNLAEVVAAPLTWGSAQLVWLSEADTALQGLSLPFAATPSQWHLALLVGVSVWLVGNRLLVAGVAERPEPFQENA